MKKLLLAVIIVVLFCKCTKDDDQRHHIGSLYIKNGTKGIIYHLSEDGQHGKIVTLDEAYIQWSKSSVYTGTIDEDDGRVNMNIICNLPDWRENYPAFAWCADKGTDWYLPSINELKILQQSGILQKKFCEYWSSTEDIDLIHCSYYLIMADGNIDSSGKYYNNYVRAISSF